MIVLKSGVILRTGVCAVPWGLGDDGSTVASLR
jgi:hypothetical protein